MFKFQIITKEDLKEAAKIDRRRRLEEERKSRIFNQPQRLFGIDYGTLEQQIDEKRQQKQLENEQEQKYILEQKRIEQIIQRKELELKKQKDQIKSELYEYRNRYQRPEDRREYDIETYHKRIQPMRTSDFDQNLGISSAQVFSGEDLMGDDRLKAQKDLQKSWLDHQIEERKRAEIDRNKTDDIIYKNLLISDRQTMEYDAIERNDRRRMLEEISNYNKQLALEKEEERKRIKKEEQEDNLAEIYNHLTSDMLTENKDIAQSSLGHTRKIAYMYRGMTDSELEKFKQEQQIYLEDKKKRENETRLLDKQWENTYANQIRAITLKQLEFDRNRRNHLKELIEENEILAEEQKTRIKAREEYLSKNYPTNEYFTQFNTTSR